MDMLITILLLIIGFALLVKGSDFFVDGSASIARLMGIPAVIVGLTIVSMGTSAPEAAVSITAGYHGSNEIAISNLVGSNTFNLLCVAGLSAVITPFIVDRDIIKRDYPLCLGVMVLSVIFAVTGSVISRIEGIILLVLFITYIVYLVLQAIKNRETEKNLEKPMSPLKSVILIIVGLAAIIGGGQLVVNSAKTIARVLGMTETLIGVTICAIGTSLPELVTSVVAARKGQSEIAMGNVVGSNIFNLMFVMGMSSALTPIGVVPEALIDAFIMLIVNILGWFFCLKDKRMGRKEGIFLVILYIVYTVYLLMR